MIWRKDMLNIELERINTGFDGSSGFCYVHARMAVAPDGFAVLTTQKLRMKGCDAFRGIEATSREAGGEWGPIVAEPGLARRKWDVGNPDVEAELAMCDGTPFYHHKTGKFLIVGHCALYDKNDNLLAGIHARATTWSVYDRGKGWRGLGMLEMPPNFLNSGAGCVQMVELEDGSLLIPAYRVHTENEEIYKQHISGAFVMRCSFDGDTLKYVEHGNILEKETGRGFGEPSIVRINGKFFLTLRNDDTTYVATSTDGLHFGEPQEWLFDDGTPLGSYNTQEHWITGKNALYLVYTRRTPNNNHIFRHRAPLFIAEVDQETCRVIRSTEQIAVPERGARLGNFGCCQCDDGTAIITAAEWMQTNPPDPYDYRVCMKYGSDNSIWIAKVSNLK